MDPESDRYCAYMLRVWQVKKQDRTVWRISLDNAHTNERLNFSSLDALCDYLQRQLGVSPHASNGNNEQSNGG